MVYKTKYSKFARKKEKYRIQFSKPDVKLTQDDMKKIQTSIESGWFCNGKYVQELEKHFRDKFKVKYAIACSNCTSGLIIAFKVLDIKNKDVAIPVFTWPSTLFAIECNENYPIFRDVNKDTWNMYYDDSYYADAVISVDVFGNESYIETKKPIIYDAAHSYGLENLGHRGDIEVVSLSFTKPVTSMQGGMILFNRDDLYNETRELVNLSAKMCEVNAYIGLNQAKTYDHKLRIKKIAMNMYKTLIKVPYTTQKVSRNSNYSTFCVLFDSKKERDKIAESIKKNNIEAKIYYEPLVRSFPNADDIYSRILALPTYKEVIPKIPKICKIINGAI